MSAVAADSESELRRSGKFELIFPVPGTAHKYLKFFDGPRPLERMLLANSTIKSGTDKAALTGGGVSSWRGGSVERRGGRNGAAKKGRKGRLHESVSPVRELQFP